MVYRTVSNVLDWPRMLPHYRWVKLIGGNRDWLMIEMAAIRSFIPIKWTSLTRIDPVDRCIYFRHIGGLTRGMEVEWTMEERPDGTEVCIFHDLSRLKVPVVRSCLGKLVTSRCFVEAVADQTLLCMKRWIEDECKGQL